MNDREASLPRRTPRRECWRAIEEWWAMQGSNLAPLPCEYTAPVVLISLPSRFASNNRFRGLFRRFLCHWLRFASGANCACIFDLVKIHVLFSGYIWAITAQ